MMRKTYEQPAARTVQLRMDNAMVAGTSGGVGNGAKVGNAYSASDQSYSRQGNAFPDDEE